MVLLVVGLHSYFIIHYVFLYLPHFGSVSGSLSVLRLRAITDFASLGQPHQ